MEWTLLSFCLLINHRGRASGNLLALCSPCPMAQPSSPPLMLLSEVRLIPLPSSLLECASSVHEGRGLIKSQHSGIGS